MNHPKTFCTLIALALVGQFGFPQTGRIKYNNQPLFLSGVNLAWVTFAADVGPGATNHKRFADIMLQTHDYGGNVLRWWLHTNGTVTPQFDEAGFVIGPGSGTIADMRKVLDLAWEREIGVILVLWSFDMLRLGIDRKVLDRNTLLLTDTNYTRAYIGRCLIPMVDSLGAHPAILAWEIFNEPEGMSLPPSAGEFGWPFTRHVPMATIQRFVNRCAGAIHRRDSTALVTNGSWSFKALTDVTVASIPKSEGGASSLGTEGISHALATLQTKYRTDLPEAQIIAHLEAVRQIANYNYYSDSRLIAAGGDPVGILDFYSVHYYAAIDPTNPVGISPFHNPATLWGLSKPIVVGEFAMQNTLGIPKTCLYDTLLQKGYAGALAWSWTDVDISSPEDMLSGMRSLWDRHREEVDVKGVGGLWPTAVITAPVNGTSFPESSDVTITAEANTAEGSVVSVDFFISDTEIVGHSTTLPHGCIWKGVPTGRYALTAVVTDTRGRFRTSDRVSITVGSPDLPYDFSLSQNYPNPFNPSTVVSCQWPVASDVTLIVYDLLGRQVVTLLDEKKQPGVCTVTFDGSALASGVYVYRLTAGTFTAVKKMLLMK